MIETLLLQTTNRKWYIVAIPMTLSDLRGHAPIAGLLKCEFFVQLCTGWPDFYWRSASRVGSLCDSRGLSFLRVNATSREVSTGKVQANSQTVYPSGYSVLSTLERLYWSRLTGVRANAVLERDVHIFCHIANVAGYWARHFHLATNVSVEQ